MGSYGDYNLYAINPDGILKWKYKTGSSINSSPTIALDGTVYVGSDDGYLYAFAPETPSVTMTFPNGGEYWTVGTSQNITWSYTSVSNVKLEYSTNNGSTWTTIIASIATSARSYPWKVPNAPSTQCLVKISDVSNSAVYDISDSVFSINIERLVFKYYTGNSIAISSPAISSDSTIYIGSTDNNLYAINSDGTLKWKYNTSGDISSSPLIGIDRKVYFGSADYHIYALNSDGTLNWKYKTGNEVGSSPAIDFNGTIYVGSGDYYIYVLNSNGTLKWKYKTGNSITSSPAIGTDGTIYVGSADHYIYALNYDGSLNPNNS